MLYDKHSDRAPAIATVPACLAVRMAAAAAKPPGPPPTIATSRCSCYRANIVGRRLDVRSWQHARMPARQARHLARLRLAGQHPGADWDAPRGPHHRGGRSVGPGRRDRNSTGSQARGWAPAWQKWSRRARAAGPHRGLHHRWTVRVDATEQSVDRGSGRAPRQVEVSRCAAGAHGAAGGWYCGRKQVQM